MSEQQPDTANATEVADCVETIRELDRFLDGELTVETHASIRHHLDGCMDCLGAFDFHAELRVVVAEKCHNDEMPPDLLARIERCFNTDIDGDGKIG
ncbi:MAG: zf-HC2 domain-containing protein [Ilumatobacteraceae bacterium]|nr:zf-HC2 domain-containing protein [Ilumatobacteraceae bacterium]